MTRRHVLLLVVAISAAVAGALLAMRFTPPAELRAATRLPAPRPLAEFSLVDPAGNSVTPAELRGRWHLLFFGFTHCPDVCPTTLQVLSAATAEMRNRGRENVPRIVLVSVDPERDTPDVVGAYVSAFGEDHLGITGERPEMEKLTRDLGIYHARVALDDGDYTMDHSAAIVVLDPEARFHAVFGSSPGVDDLVHDLELLTDG